MQRTKNRWLIAASAIGVHLPIGSVYAYSVLVLPLYELHGWSKSHVMAAFSLAILLLGFSAAFLGPRVERMGPRLSARVAACLYAAGIATAGLGIKTGSLVLFIAGYGALSGVGLGIGYITPVAMLVKWFPDRRGLATGMAVMGFGFGSLVFGPVMVTLMQYMPLWMVLCSLAVVYGTMIFAASCYLALPPAEWAPKGYVPPSSDAPARRRHSTPDELPVATALKTNRFRCLWIMFFINICCGISIIAMASPMAQEITGMSAMQAAGLVGIMGLFNGLGRFFWASLSDYLGRPLIFMSFFALQIVAFIVLSNTSSALVFQCVILLVVSCYGGGFSLLPAFLSDMFGTASLASLLGYALTAWGLAGIVGPNLSSFVVAQTGSYVPVMYGFAVLMGLGLLFAARLFRELRNRK